MMLGRNEERRKKVDSVINDAVAQFNRAEVRREAERRLRTESTVDNTPGRRRGLPEPPAWWHDDNASRSSIVAARQLGGIKAKVKN